MAVAETTTYRVETLYDVTDRASNALQQIGAAAEKAGKSSETLRQVLLGLGAGALALRGIHAAKSAFIDFNANVERTKISLATVTAMNLKAPFELARVETDKLYETFQKMAAASPATTQDFINMANMISSGVLQAGLGLKGLESITKGAILAQTALGAPAEMMGLEVTQMLAGTLSLRDRFARQLLTAVGENDYLKFNKYDAGKRAAITKKAFEHDALGASSKAIETSFSGAMSTLKDNVEIGLGKAGMPLFKAVTKELNSWNEWMVKNKLKLEEMGKSLGDGLVKGFQMAKTAAQFLVDNAKTLMEIGKVWLLFKVAGGVGGTLSGLGGKVIDGVGGIGSGGKLSKIEEAFNRMARAPALAAGLRFGPMAGSMVGGAISGVGGMAAAAGSLGLSGALQIGVIANQLGEYLGVHKAITQVIDPQRVKYEQLMVSMKQWDDALIASRDKLAGRTGATGTVSYGNAIGSADFAKVQAESMKDAIRTMRDTGTSLFLREAKSTDILRKGGMTGEEIEKFLRATPSQQMGMQSAARQRYEDVSSRADIAAGMTGTWVNKAMGAFSESERASIDLKEGTQRVYELIHRMLSNPNMQFALGKGIAGLDLLEVMAELRGTKSGITQQTKPNQTNIKIDRVEVSAKDPDRWIAELDAKAKRKVRAPSQPRAAIRGGF